MTPHVAAYTEPMLDFETTIIALGPAAAIPLTTDQAAELSSAKQPPVVVTIGDASQRLRVTRMAGDPCIGLSKAARAALGVEIGDTVRVRISLDVAERTVEIPALLAEVMGPQHHDAWQKLSYTKRREIAEAITSAKQEATRARRVAKALAELEAL